jgi:hypothetical protein
MLPWNVIPSAAALHSTFENVQPGMRPKILAFMVAPPGLVSEGK